MLIRCGLIGAACNMVCLPSVPLQRRLAGIPPMTVSSAQPWVSQHASGYDTAWQLRCTGSRLEAPGAYVSAAVVTRQMVSELPQDAGSALEENRGSAVPTPRVRGDCSGFGNPRGVVRGIRSTRSDSACPHQTLTSRYRGQGSRLST